MESVDQRLGPQATVEDLLDLVTEEMPQHDPDEDASQNEQTFPKLEDDLDKTLK